MERVLPREFAKQYPRKGQKLKILRRAQKFDPRCKFLLTCEGFSPGYPVQAVVDVLPGKGFDFRKKLSKKFQSSLTKMLVFTHFLLSILATMDWELL